INGMTDKAWSVLIPVKVLAEAKSRLASLAGLTDPRRAELALALASDTVTAVLGSDAVARVVVITDDQAAAMALAALGALIVPDEPRAGRARGRPPCPPTCPPCAPSRSAGRCAPPRPGRRPSWPTRPATARRCTPRRREPRSGPRSAWPRAPGTPRAAPSNSAWMASPGCAGTWTRHPTCAARPRSGWARTARRSLPNCSDVHHGAGERPGDPGHRLDMSGDKTAELVDVGRLSAHDDVVGAGDVLRLGDTADLADERGHIGGFADFCLDEDVSLHHEVL